MGKQRNHYLISEIIFFAFLNTLLKDPHPQRTVIVDGSGNNSVMSFNEIQCSIFTLIRNPVTLIAPERGRSAWPALVRIGSKK